MDFSIELIIEIKGVEIVSRDFAFQEFDWCAVVEVQIDAPAKGNRIKTRFLILRSVMLPISQGRQFSIWIHLAMEYRRCKNLREWSALSMWQTSSSDWPHDTPWRITTQWFPVICQSITNIPFHSNQPAKDQTLQKTLRDFFERWVEMRRSRWTLEPSALCLLSLPPKGIILDWFWFGSICCSVCSAGFLAVSIGASSSASSRYLCSLQHTNHSLARFFLRAIFIRRITLKILCKWLFSRYPTTVRFGTVTIVKAARGGRLKTPILAQRHFVMWKRSWNTFMQTVDS